MLKLDDESNDHWHSSAEFQRDMLDCVNDHVKETFVGDRLGVLNPCRWSEATGWLLEDEKSFDPLLGFDKTNLWAPPPNVLHGNELGRTILQEANASALKFAKHH